MKKLTAGMVGENALLDILRAQMPSPPPGFSLPIHDVAHFPPPPPGCETIMTTDMLVAGVHFDPQLIPAYYVGWRAMTANLSDIAAAGGEPLAISLSLGLPPQTETSYLTGLYRGMIGCLGYCCDNAAIVGGDVVRSPILTISIAVIGYTSSKHRTGRSGALAGDMIMVSGWTGRAALGWQLLQSHMGWLDRQAVGRFLHPTPRISLGQELAKMGATTMTDTSDSLFEAIMNIAKASCVSVEVWTDKLPLSDTFSPPLDVERGYDLVWGGGEDYELMAAISPEKLPRLKNLSHIYGIPLTVIGRCNHGEKVNLMDSQGNLQRPPSFFQHF